MKVLGNYQDDGYAHLQGLIPPEVALAFLQTLKQDMGSEPIPLSRVGTHPNLLKRAAFEAYGYSYKPMLGFLWGLTPIVSQLVGRDLLPTYNYLRIYQAGDVCHVHSDRYSCEHSLSLTLGYSDGRTWDLEVERERSQPSARVEPGFGDSAYRGIAMMPGDALLYQGVHHRHGRTTPNPNRWSAHLFLHWVDRDGPHRDQAFDGKIALSPVDFRFS
ncbi:MAG: hypothetical protein J7494_02005 [Sphingobium sp.]|nr:hypothetical protein [Sphingobium sp.]